MEAKDVLPVERVSQDQDMVSLLFTSLSLPYDIIHSLYNRSGGMLL